MALTDAAIRNAKSPDKPKKIADSGGLFLLVKPNGSKLWRYRYRIAGRENLYAIGEYFNDKREGHVSLDDARKERDRAKVLVKQGVHPSHQRQAARLATHADGANTFKAVADEWIAKKESTWTPYYKRQVERTFKADVYPKIGKLPVRSITAAHLLAILQEIEGRGANTVALLVRQWCSAVFRYAVSTMRADTDPASALKGAVHRPKVKHHKPLTRAEIKKLVKKLDKDGGYATTNIALRLMLLTFVRTVELRKAEWSEIDFDTKEWRLPAERMKMREPHIVPLSDQAISQLRELHMLTGNRVHLFPNYRRPNDCMTATTLNRALERMKFSGSKGIGFSAHGFRATASTMLNEMGYRPDVIERQLAHKERNKTRASYNQAEYMDERRTMMQQWADLIDEIAKGSKVVAGKFGKSA